jgi:hypothetical protein
VHSGPLSLGADSEAFELDLAMLFAVLLIGGLAELDSTRYPFYLVISEFPPWMHVREIWVAAEIHLNQENRNC